MSDTPIPADDLRLALGTIADAQRAFLADLRQRCADEDPRFGEAFRTWQLALTRIRLHLLEVEQQLLHYLMVPSEYRPWRELPTPAKADGGRHRHWQDICSPWLRSLRIDTCYRRIAAPLDPRAEAATADLLTDLTAVAATCDATAATLHNQLPTCEAALIEELAFYHLIAPWKDRASQALFDCLRWFDAFLAEHELL